MKILRGVSNVYRRIESQKDRWSRGEGVRVGRVIRGVTFKGEFAWSLCFRCNRTGLAE